MSKGVQVESNQVAEVATTLEVGDATAVVEVTAGAELVKTDPRSWAPPLAGKRFTTSP